MAARRGGLTAKKWAGWLCLCLSIVPYYSRQALPPPRPLPAGAGRAAGDIVQLTTPESARTEFRIGLPFSPWFTFNKEAVYTPLAGDAYRSEIRSEGGFGFLTGRRRWRRWALRCWAGGGGCGKDRMNLPSRLRRPNQDENGRPLAVAQNAAVWQVACFVAARSRR